MVLYFVLIFIIWLAYELRKSSREHDAASKNFWDKEREAFLTPRKSVSDIRFIEVPEDIIPPEIIPDKVISAKEAPDSDIAEDSAADNSLYDEINSLSSALRSLTIVEIADLSEYTNTELRMKYGAPNFSRLSKADANYDKLVMTLSDLIPALLDAGRNDEARALLGFASRNHISSGAIESASSTMSIL